ncbi:MAG: ATPase, T2SS/T4P/T4SS family, partial [Planctomycetota bacterium]
TVHTNDSASTITRMVDQGVEPYLVASSIVLIIAQRLVRTICPHCKTVEPVDEEWAAKLKKVGMTPDEIGGEIAYGPGCDECFHSGYAGRTAIYEFLPVTERIRTLVMEGAGATEIKREQIGQGHQTLRSDGQAKIRQGITTPDEVLRVTQLDV